MKRRLKKAILERSSKMYNFDKTKSGLDFICNDSISRRRLILRGGYIVCAILFISIVSLFSILSMNKDEDNRDEEIDNGDVIPFLRTNYFHIKIIDVDDRELYYKYISIKPDEEDKFIPYKLVTIEIKEIFFMNNNYWRSESVGDVLYLGIPLDMYEYYNMFDEFLVYEFDIGMRPTLLYLSETEKLNQTIVSVKYHERGQFYRFTPISNEQIKFVHPLHPSSFLDMNNYLIDNPEIEYKDGITLENLRIYFEVLRSIKYEDRFNDQNLK